MIILFDGICNLCNSFVRFILKRDKQKRFQFASLQSKYGAELSLYFNLAIITPETIVLYDGQKIITESDAVLKIVRSLGGIWKGAVILLIVPRFIRNWCYRLIARNRYKLFGKREQCMIPTADMKGRFVDEELFISKQDYR